MSEGVVFWPDPSPTCWPGLEKSLPRPTPDTVPFRLHKVIYPCYLWRSAASEWFPTLLRHCRGRVGKRVGPCRHPPGASAASKDMEAVALGAPVSTSFLNGQE